MAPNDDTIPTSEVDGLTATIDGGALGEFTIDLVAASPQVVRAIIRGGDEFSLRRQFRPGSCLRIRWSNATGTRSSSAPVLEWESGPVVRLGPFSGGRELPRRDVRCETRLVAHLTWLSDGSRHDAEVQLSDLSIRGFGCPNADRPPGAGSALCVLHLSPSQSVTLLVTEQRTSDDHLWFAFDRIARRDRATVAAYVLASHRSEVAA